MSNDELSETVASRGEKVGQNKLQRNAKTASQKEKKLLDNFQKYYKGKCSLEYAAEAAHMPLRAVVEFMRKNKLPYYSNTADTAEGLKKISEIRLTI